MKRTQQRQYRIAALPYLGARPLVAGLHECPDASVRFVACSEAAGLLAEQWADVAMLPTGELPRIGPQAVVIPAGCVASAGRTLLARIFSKVPADRLTRLWYDAESRSSVALTRLLWAEEYARALELHPVAPGAAVPERAEAVLLVGDAVVADPPLGFDWQIDIGEMWFEATGLPFVFAAWAALDGADCRQLYEILLAARRRGQRRLRDIACVESPLCNWPVDLARRYLTQDTQFAFTEAAREGLEEFLARSAERGIVRCRAPMRYYVPRAGTPQALS